jgi:hypothetical protein
MSGNTTKVMLEAYKEEREPIGFFAGQFTVPRNGIHNSEVVEIDIKRNGKKIAIPVKDLTTGARTNVQDAFTNKELKPAVLREKTVINAFSLVKRDAGEIPFKRDAREIPYDSPDFRGKALMRAMDAGSEMNDKIQRTIELQGAQVLQTGTITLNDEKGNAIYQISFSPKATHFPTVSVDWTDAGSDKIGDLKSLCDVINSDGKHFPDMLEIGDEAYELLINDDAVKDKLDLTRLLGSGIVPLERLGNGGTYRGTIEVGSYKLDIWTYPQSYEDPQTGNDTKYLGARNVIVRASSGRLDATFGLIPKIGGRDPRLPAGLFNRVSSREDMIDIQYWATILGNGDGLEIEVGTRPLLIPTAIDTFGCLNTVAP